MSPPIPKKDLKDIVVDSNVPLTLKSIYLRKSELYFSDTFDPTIPGQKLSGKFKIDGVEVKQLEFKPNDIGAPLLHYCRFSTSFKFLYLSVDGHESADISNDDHWAASIAAEIVVDYVIIDQTQISPQLLDEWSKTNALKHAWPYWREYCQSTLSRMSLPVVVMPLLNIFQSPPDT